MSSSLSLFALSSEAVPWSELIQNASKLVLAYEKQHSITVGEPTRRKTKRGRWWSVSEDAES